MNYFGKRQLMLASLVVALGTAVYLNWQLGGNKDFPISNSSTSSSKELGEAQFVNNNVTENKNQEENNNDNNSHNYFEEVRKNREKSREESTDVIKGILSDANSNESIKQEAIKQASEIAKIIQQEANIESLFKAKGINECLVFIHNDECTAVVKGPIDETTVLAAKEIVAGQGGIDIGKVKIIENNS